MTTGWSIGKKPITPGETVDSHYMDDRSEVLTRWTFIFPELWDVPLGTGFLLLSITHLQKRRRRPSIETLRETQETLRTILVRVNGCSNCIRCWLVAPSYPFERFKGRKEERSVRRKRVHTMRKRMITFVDTVENTRVIRPRYKVWFPPTLSRPPPHFILYCRFIFSLILPPPKIVYSPRCCESRDN